MAMMTTIEKILAKAQALEAQAAALRLAVTILNGDVHTQKRATAAKTIDQAISLRHAQRNGTPAEGEPAPKAARASKWAATKARRATKREEILAIVREYGKPMPIRELSEAARAQGIASLTGISGSVRSGHLKRTERQGKSCYSLGPAARHA